MPTDYEIGRVVAIDTAQVTVEINRDLKALTRSTFEGTIDVGTINSYLIIPVGSRRIVAMVTRVVLSEENELLADKNMITLPLSRRLMKATMIGTIDENRFKQGISLFPVLDSPVLLTTRDDLDAIFGKKAESSTIDCEEPGYCISIGRSAIFPDYEVKIDPDAFFGKHAAIIGSTGSGKSCTIATILQSVIEHPQVKQTRFIILDTNGEYRSAFQNQDEKGDWDFSKQSHRSLYIPTAPEDPNRLAIPYWFMNSDDFVRLFRASPGVQRPVLLNALSSARNSVSDADAWMQLRDDLLKDFIRILGLSAQVDSNAAKTINQLCEGMLSYLKIESTKTVIILLSEKYTIITGESLLCTFNELSRVVQVGIASLGTQYEKYAVIDIQKRKQIEDHVRPLISILSRLPCTTETCYLATADSPCYFGKSDFRYNQLENAISRDEATSSRARDNCSTMLMRIYRLLEDSRFSFMFGPQTSEWPIVKHSLASFLRDIIGLESHSDNILSEEAMLANDKLPFYDRQRKGASQTNVVIIDLSLLASEVLENVTALFGRLIHEFLQRLSEPGSGIQRGEFPIVLVLEEAQNYIAETRKLEDESISKQVFERIAREGRKYGLGLVVASQRPSELSKTVLSQCNSFIVHRLQNPEDLRYFREIVPGIFGQLLEQLPALAPRSALVLGECVQAPALVVMREVDPAPRSKNPKFFKSWTTASRVPNIEKICEKWEGITIE